MQQIIFLSALLFLTNIAPMIGQEVNNTAELHGIATDGNTGEPILVGAVAIYQNDVLITGTETDFDGKYYFSDLEPGKYSIELRYVGYLPTRIDHVILESGQLETIDIQITEGIHCEGSFITRYYFCLLYTSPSPRDRG